MALPNVNQLTSQLRMLPDPALQQAAMMYKNDPYILPMIISEDTARKQMRAAQQARMMGGEPPKVNEQAIAAIGQMPQPQGGPQGPGPQGGPMPPQGAMPQGGPQGAGPAPGGPGGIAALQAPNMQRMADGGIAGYPDDEEVGMAEGGVARYNGQDESRVKPDVQFARDQEAFGILLSELQKAQAQAAQGNPRAQSDVEALQGELRRHIKRNPSFAQMLTSALPMASAQAAPAAPQAAPMPAQAAGTPGEGRLAAPITAAAGATGLAGLGAAMAGKEAGAAQFRPGTTMGQAIRRILGGTAAVPGAVMAGGAAATGTAANQMAAMAPEQREQFYSNPMLGAMGGDAALAAAIMNAGTGDIAPPKAPMPYAEQMANVGKFLIGAPRKARTPPPAPAIPAPAARGPMSDAERARLMEANEPPATIDPSALAKDEKKDIIDAAKAATPKAERKGLTNDDYLVMGLTMMANPSRQRGLAGVFETVGLGGLAAREARKRDEELALKKAQVESESAYRKAHADYYGAQAKFLTEEKADLALRQKAASLAEDAFTKWQKSTAGMLATPAEQEAYRQKLVAEYFAQLRVKGAPELSSGAGAMPAIPEGVKVRQVG